MFFYYGQEAKQQSIKPKPNPKQTSKEHSGTRAISPASQIRWEDHTCEGTSSHPLHVPCSSPSPASATAYAHGRVAVASLNGRRREGKRVREKKSMQQYQQQMPCGSRIPWMASRWDTPVSLIVACSPGDILVTPYMPDSFKEFCWSHNSLFFYWKVLIRFFSSN